MLSNLNDGFEVYSAIKLLGTNEYKSYVQIEQILNYDNKDEHNN